MRRAQSLRHQPRPSSVVISDDLGVLREQPEETVEDSLRRQLLAKERENDKLQAQILALQDQLSLRPPVEQIQELEKEYKNLDLLLQGTQRENERCMVEMERFKNREKMLERELAKLAGENWQTSLNITPSIVYTMRGAFSPTGRRNPPLAELSQDTEFPPTSDNSKAVPAAAAVEATMAHIEQVRLLILGMEQRLQTREEKLVKTVERAENETSRFDALRKEVDTQA